MQRSRPVDPPPPVRSRLRGARHDLPCARHRMAAALRCLGATCRRLRRRRTTGTLAFAAVMVAAVPFGGLGALQRQLVTGTIADRVPEGRFIATIGNDPARVSWEVARLKRHPPTRSMVYVLGGSSVRECMTSDADLAAAIAERGEVSPGVMNLASNMQSLPETLAIIDNLPRGRGGVIVIGVHAITFISASEAAHLQLRGETMLMRSPSLADLVAQRSGEVPANSIAPGLRSFLEKYRTKRGVDAFAGVSLVYHQHHYGQGSVLSAYAKRRHIANWQAGRGAPNGEFFTHFDYSAALLTACVRRARGKGFEVLLMDDPSDTAIVGHAFDRYKDKYRPLCSSLVETRGAHFVDLNRRAGITSGDMRDLYHLVPSGRLKWTPKLGAAVAAIFADHPPVVPSPQAGGSTASPGPGAGTAPAATGNAAEAAAAQPLAGLLARVRTTLAGTTANAD